MADEKPSTSIFHLTTAELCGLADRLFARAASSLFPGQPLLQADMGLAAAVIWATAKKMSPDATLAIDNGD